MVATSTALMVCMRFSAWSNTMEAGPSKTLSVTSMQSMPNVSGHLLPDDRLPVVEGRKAMHELGVSIAGHCHHLLRHAEGAEQPDALGPLLFWLPHGKPNIGVDEIRAWKCQAKIGFERELSADSHSLPQ